MHKVTYSMTASLDGFTMDTDGRFDWSEPDDEVFRVFLDQLRGVDVHLMGGSSTRRCCSGRPRTTCQV
ncbi:hypothetical protein ACIPJ2_04605 [Curtobacterium sp. NPDC090217]|uniref:hypothetical protein n=1 Tax=Curtobacterium sp. NPDC090217 TaxID=3363970 RepID=UPI00381B4DE2